MQLLRTNVGDGGTLRVSLYYLHGIKYYVIVYKDEKPIEKTGFYKHKRAADYYEKVLREF